MNIGENIKAMRKQKGLDQKGLAKLLNVSNRTISSWETNRTQPDMESIGELCKIFECSPSDFSIGADYTVVLSVDEKALIEFYRNAPNDARDTINRIVAYAKLLGIKKEN